MVKKPTYKEQEAIAKGDADKARKNMTATQVKTALKKKAVEMTNDAPKPRKRSTRKIYEPTPMVIVREAYKAPGAKPGFLSTVLSSVSRDTLMFTNDHCGAGVTRAEMYSIGIKAGSALGMIEWRRNDATRKHEPYITR